ncbi:hypothetical protein D3C81_1611190 [compost metagenome]
MPVDPVLDPLPAGSDVGAVVHRHLAVLYDLLQHDHQHDRQRDGRLPDGDAGCAAAANEPRADAEPPVSDGAVLGDDLDDAFPRSPRIGAADNGPARGCNRQPFIAGPKPAADLAAADRTARRHDDLLWPVLRPVHAPGSAVESLTEIVRKEAAEYFGGFFILTPIAVLWGLIFHFTPLLEEIRPF